MTALRVRVLALAASVLALVLPSAHAQAPAEEGPPRTAFKVCADPNSLPFSNSKGQGLENRIADLFAKDLGLPVKYDWYPNRMNFIRNTLRYKLPTEDYPCDIVMGVPAEFDQVSTTQAYYRSTYVLLFPKGKALDGVHSSDDLLAMPKDKLKALRIGVYDRSPGSLWLARHQMVDLGVPYKMMNADPDQIPGEDIAHDLLAGKLDAAILWGPIGGYFARPGQAGALVVAPMISEPNLPMEFSMAMGVRYGEPHWKQQVEGLLERHAGDIKAILADYGVPLVAMPAGNSAKKQ